MILTTMSQSICICLLALRIFLFDKGFVGLNVFTFYRIQGSVTFLVNAITMISLTADPERDGPDCGKFA